MKNIPRLFIDSELSPGTSGPLTAGQAHYLTKVMRSTKFLAFNNGTEYEAEVSARPQIDAKILIPLGRAGRREAADGAGSGFAISSATGRADPSGIWTFFFSPVKKIEDLVSGMVQMGAGVLQPVITERAAARHINWDRIKKIIIENCEQSGRNSLPELRAPIPFSALPLSEIIYGDERKIKDGSEGAVIPADPMRVRRDDDSPRESFKLLIGPEGGFSDAEFAALDAAGAAGVSLGPLILRAEVAAVALAAKVIKT